MPPDDVSIPSLKMPSPFSPHNQAWSRSFTGLKNAPDITIRSFSMLFLVFTALLVHANSAAVGADQPIRAADGIPGPPSQAGHNTPKKEGQETPPVTTSYLTGSTFALASTFAPTSAFAPTSTFVQRSSTPIATPQISTSSIAIYPTIISTLSAVSILSSSTGSQEFTLITATFPLSSSILSILDSTLAASSAVDPSSTTSSSSPITTTVPSQWPAISPATATSMPTNTAIASTSRSQSKRNLTIILTTVLLTTTIAFIASLLLLTRCCTRRPYLPTLCLRLRTRTLLPIPDEEIPPPSSLEKPKTTAERDPQKPIPPSLFSARFLTYSGHSTPPSPLSTQTFYIPPPSPITPLSLTSTRSFVGLTLPSPTARFPTPSPLRSHPPVPAASAPPLPPQPSIPSKSLRHHSRISSAAASSAASSSKSARSSGSGNGFLAEKPPDHARFTFGGGAESGAESGWAWVGGEGGGEVDGMETERGETERAGMEMEMRVGIGL